MATTFAVDNQTQCDLKMKSGEEEANEVVSLFIVATFIAAAGIFSLFVLSENVSSSNMLVNVKITQK